MSSEINFLCSQYLCGPQPEKTFFQGLISVCTLTQTILDFFYLRPSHVETFS